MAREKVPEPRAFLAVRSDGIGNHRFNVCCSTAGNDFFFWFPLLKNIKRVTKKGDGTFPVAVRHVAARGAASCHANTSRKQIPLVARRGRSLGGDRIPVFCFTIASSFAGSSFFSCSFFINSQAFYYLKLRKYQPFFTFLFFEFNSNSIAKKRKTKWRHRAAQTTPAAHSFHTCQSAGGPNALGIFAYFCDFFPERKRRALSRKFFTGIAS